MTTLEPEQKDILEKLNEIALDAHWGTVDRVHTAECPNGIPKGVAIIQEAIEEIKRLRELNGELYTFKRKLEDELIEQGFAEYADEEFKSLSDYKAENAEAKELCRKKIGDLKINEWIKIMKLAGYQVEAVSQKELIEQVVKATATEIFLELIRATESAERQGGQCSLDYLKVKARQFGVEIDNE